MNNSIVFFIRNYAELFEFTHFMVMFSFVSMLLSTLRLFLYPLEASENLWLPPYIKGLEKLLL